MKNFLLIALLLPLSLFASTQEAEQAYADGEIQTALDLYTAIAQEKASAGLLYNIANCHFRLGNTGEAVLFYERAARLAPGDEDILTNLSMARQQVVDRIAELPTLEIGNYWERFKAGKDFDQWARISLFTCLFAFIALAIMLFMRGAWRKVFLSLGILLIFFTVFAASVASAHRNDLLNGSDAIIMSDRAEILSAPDSGTKLYVLHEGTKVEILRTDGDWNEIKLSNGNVGWVNVEKIERI